MEDARTAGTRGRHAIHGVEPTAVSPSQLSGIRPLSPAPGSKAAAVRILMVHLVRFEVTAGRPTFDVRVEKKLLGRPSTRNTGGDSTATRQDRRPIRRRTQHKYKAKPMNREGEPSRDHRSLVHLRSMKVSAAFHHRNFIWDPDGIL